MLDTYREIETPEGVELHLRAAGPIPRALAFGIDLSLRVFIYLVLSMVLAVAGGMGKGLFLIAFFFLEWFYPVLFEVYWQGETPGKRMLGLRTLNDNGTPIGWSASLVRNLLRAVDFLPFFYAFGLLSILLTRNFKRLGDLAAGTLVVYHTRGLRGAALPEVTPMAPPRGLLLEEQKILIQYAERAPRLTDARAEELADILSPVTGLTAQAGARRLTQMASWLMGKR